MWNVWNKLLIFVIVEIKLVLYYVWCHVNWTIIVAWVTSVIGLWWSCIERQIRHLGLANFQSPAPNSSYPQILWRRVSTHHALDNSGNIDNNLGRLHINGKIQISDFFIKGHLLLKSKSSTLLWGSLSSFQNQSQMRIHNDKWEKWGLTWKWGKKNIKVNFDARAWNYHCFRISFWRQFDAKEFLVCAWDASLKTLSWWCILKVNRNISFCGDCVLDPPEIE